VTKHKHEDIKPQPAVAPETQADNSGDAKPQVAVAHDPQKDPLLEKLQAELQAAKDRELRCHAELDNFRKRAARELDDKLRYANMTLLRDLLPALDNMDRAIEAAAQNTEANALLDGIKMVRQQMEETLKRHDCQPIDALYKPFNPHVHHAVMQQPSADHPANTVLMVTQTGYQLHDRVVRPSQVIVSTTP
jgi:molecular chaperone GrpE